VITCLYLLDGLKDAPLFLRTVRTDATNDEAGSHAPRHGEVAYAGLAHLPLARHVAEAGVRADQAEGTVLVRPFHVTVLKHGYARVTIDGVKKLTKVLHDRIIVAASGGNYRKAIVKAVGIGESTLRLWLQKGREDMEAGLNTRYAKLRKDLLDVAAKVENELVGIIKEAGKATNPSAWKAAAWFLERRYPDRWALSQRLNLKGKVEGSGITGPSMDDLRQMVRNILALPGIADNAEEILLKLHEAEKSPPADSPQESDDQSEATPE